VYAGELRIGALLAAAPKPVQAQALPRFPGSSRDVALLLDRSIPFARIASTVEAQRPKLLESWEVFDVYTGEHVAADKRSVALRMVYRDPNASDADSGRTLTDDEVTGAHEQLVTVLTDRLGAERR